MELFHNHMTDEVICITIENEIHGEDNEFFLFG
jgi:hypothetical protein